MGSLARLKAVVRFPNYVRTSFPDVPTPWPRDNKPGPYPKTEEEKLAAAKKYGLLREEYEPYPDDGDGYGDYPKIESVNVEEKDPYYNYGDRHFRRDFCEPVPVDFIAYTHGRASKERQKFSFTYMLSAFLLAVGICSLPYVLPAISDFRYHHPIMEKQYPAPGVTHYTFDIVDKEGRKEH